MSGAQSMNLEQALSAIGIEDRFEDVDQSTLSMLFGSARIDQPGQRTEEAIAVLETAMEPPTTTTTIDSDGDVILVVGSNKQRRLQVSSTSLSKASPVFKSLFGPHFREGQAERSADNPIEIALPDDDPKSMTYLCSMLHVQEVYDETTVASLDSEAMLDLAIVIDKYDAANFVRLQMQGLLFAWDYSHGSYCEMVAMSNMIASAYLLGQSQAFSLFTNRFLTRGFNGLYGLLQERSGGVYPASVLLALSERRNSGLQYSKGLCLPCLRDNADIVDICNKHVVR